MWGLMTTYEETQFRALIAMQWFLADGDLWRAMAAKCVAQLDAERIRLDRIHDALCCCPVGGDDGCGCRCKDPEELARSWRAEVRRLQGIIEGLAERVYKQSELLSRKAEKANG